MRSTELLKLGFKDTSWTDDGEDFTEYTFEGAAFKICVSGDGFVELGIDGNFMPLHNVTTPKQIKQLIKLLT